MSFFTRSRRLPEDDLVTVDVDPGRRRRVVAAVTTAVSCLFVLFALVAPNEISRLTPGAFVRVPVEGLVGVALVLVLPARARRVVAALVGAVLGVLTIVKITDMGFFATLDRPFDPVFDWSFFGPATDFVAGAIGRVGAVGSVIAVAVLAVAVVVLMAFAVLRLTRIAAGHRVGTTRTVAVLGVVWILGAALGLPIASNSAATLAYENLSQVRADLNDQQSFTNEVATDAFRGSRGDQLLTALRGKDVLLTFVESYGRVALQDPQVNAVLDAGTKQLKAAGFASRSAFLTSSTFGGGSWLAHSTLQSGVWINNQHRYDELVGGDRLTLSSAFRRAGWRTVSDDPANTRDWVPEGTFYGYNKVYDVRNVGYHGPTFGYASMPDQYTLAAFQRNELAQPGHAPVMGEIDLVSSHTPWAPLPSMVDWTKVGDGSIFNPMQKAAKQTTDVWPDPARVRAAFGESIQYSLDALLSFVRTYGDDNLVLVFLGDHQPASIVSGDGASRDVPITIVARDPAVLDRISGWGWQDGLRPDPQAPVWPMNAFRDRFLTAFK